jgi:hypothetical protein
MKSKIWVAMVMGLLATSLSAAVATAQTSGSCDTTALMIKFDADAFAYETAYTPATFNSAAGSQLTVVGIVSLFCNPLTGLDASDPNVEYTFIWDGLVSQGTATKTRGSSTTFTTKYLGGGFRIYAGTPRNAPTALTLPPVPAPGLVPDAFGDGTLVLSGVMTDSLYVYLSRSSTGTFTSSFKANYRCTGGTLYDQVGSGISVIDGLWSPVPATNPAPPAPLGTTLLPAGWSAHPNGKWDRPAFVPPVVVRPSSWGMIKSMYR